MRSISLFALLPLAATAIAAPPGTPAATSRRAAQPIAKAPSLPAALDSALIPAYRRLSPTLAVAGQPGPEALPRLGAWGFRTVIDLRTAAEGTSAEKGPVEAQGLRYVSIPVTPQTLSWETAAAVRAELGRGAPTLLHCRSGNRVGAIFALVARLSGKRLDEAMEEGRKAGLTSPVLAGQVRAIAQTPPAKR